MRRIMLGLTALGVGCALALAGCGSGGDAANAVSIKTLQSAASNTQAAQSTEFTMSASVDVSGRHVDIQGSGASSADGTRARVNMEIPGVGEFKVLVVDDVMYMSTEGWPAGEAQLPEGKQWISFDFNDLGGQLGLNLDQLRDQARNSTPTQGLQYLEGLSGDVENLGDDSVNGEHATHYRASIDYSKVVDELPGLSAQLKERMGQLGTVPADVWIDDHDRVVKMRYSIDAAALGLPGTGTVEMTMEITSFDGPVDVEAPPADEVVSFSDVLGGQDTVSA
jgi:hypothetical protein